MIDSVALNSFSRPKPSDKFESFQLETDDVASFIFSCGNGYPGSSFVYNSTEGRLFLSNLRLIYIPSSQGSSFKSFDVSLGKIVNFKLRSSSLFNFSKNLLEAALFIVHKFQSCSLLSFNFF